MIALYPGRARRGGREAGHDPHRERRSRRCRTWCVRSRTRSSGSRSSSSRSTSKPTDQAVRQQVIERLRNVDLPPGVTPDIAPLSTAIGEIFRFRLRGDALTPQQLRTLQDWVVEKQLRLVQGVADIVTMGGTEKQYEVNPDLAKLRDYKITLSQLFTALSRANANAGGGSVTQGRQQFLVRSLGSFRIARGHRPGRGCREQGHADPREGHRRGSRGLRAAAGPVRTGRRRRHRERHRDHAKGREPVARARGAQGQDRVREREGASEGCSDRSLLRPLVAHREDAEDCVHEPHRGRDAGDARALHLPRQPARGVDRRRRDSAFAASARSSASRWSASPRTCSRWAPWTSGSSWTAR